MMLPSPEPLREGRNFSKLDKLGLGELQVDLYGCCAKSAIQPNKKEVRTITINAPMEKVFGYVGEPINLPEIMPSLVEIKDVRPLPTGGKSYRLAYKMAGVRFEGTGKHTEWVVNQRIVAKNSDGFEVTVTWIFQPEAGGTKVTFEAEYSVPVPVLGKLAEAVIVKMNEREAELILANLKDRLEA